MKPVGRILDEGRHLTRCWACNWPERIHWPLREAADIALYEQAVEWIEDYGRAGREFSIAIVVRESRFRVGWKFARLAVHDLAMHGLIWCVDRGAPQFNNRGVMRQGNCYRWKVCGPAV